jgi:hypothetical protein
VGTAHVPGVLVRTVRVLVLIAAGLGANPRAGSLALAAGLLECAYSRGGEAGLSAEWFVAMLRSLSGLRSISSSMPAAEILARGAAALLCGSLTAVRTLPAKRVLPGCRARSFAPIAPAAHSCTNGQLERPKCRFTVMVRTARSARAWASSRPARSSIWRRGIQAPGVSADKSRAAITVALAYSRSQPRSSFVHASSGSCSVSAAEVAAHTARR